MPKVDVINLENKVVGSVELSDEVFGAEVNENLLYEAVRSHMAAKRGGNAKTKTRHEVPVRARSSGSRRAPAAPVWVRSARLSGGMAALRTVRNRAITATNSPRRW